MLVLPQVTVWFRNRPTDLRLGFQGLSGLVHNEFHRTVKTGDLFVFVNKRRNAVRVLYADKTGLCLFAKKPFQGRFPNLWSDPQQGPTALKMTVQELTLFLASPKARQSRSSMC